MLDLLVELVDSATGLLFTPFSFGEFRLSIGSILLYFLLIRIIVGAVFTIATGSYSGGSKE